MDLEKAVEESRLQRAKEEALKAYEDFRVQNPQIGSDPLDRFFPNHLLYPLGLLTTASLSFGLGAGLISAAAFNLTFLIFISYFFFRVVFRIYSISSLTKQKIQFLRRFEKERLEGPPDAKDLLIALKTKVLKELEGKSDARSIAFKEKIKKKVSSLEEQMESELNEGELDALESSLEKLLEIVQDQKEAQKMLEDNSRS